METARSVQEDLAALVDVAFLEVLPVDLPLLASAAFLMDLGVVPLAVRALVLLVVWVLAAAQWRQPRSLPLRQLPRYSLLIVLFANLLRLLLLSCLGPRISLH